MALIELDTLEGQKFLEESRENGIYQPYLHSIFHKETGDKNCGIHTCALLMSAQALAKRKPVTNAIQMVPQITSYKNLPFTEADLMASPTVQNVFPNKDYLEYGTTLQEVSAILKAFGNDVTMKFASDVSPEMFCAMASKALRDANSGSGVIVNYHMGTLGQCRPVGHHTPLAGYHSNSDRFLLLDVDKYNQNCWVQTDDLFNAMSVMDTASKQSRGFCIVNKFN